MKSASMGGARWILLATCALLVPAGCSAAHPHRADPAAGSPVPVLRHLRQSVRLPFNARPERWPVVARFGYGPLPSELGYKEVPGLNPLIPSAAAVTRSGIWVADPVKGRVVHFTLAGRYRGQAPGLAEIASDMAAEPDGTLVVLDNLAAGTVRILRPGHRRLSPPIEETAGEAPGDDPLYRLVTTRATVAIWADRQHPLDSAFRMQRNKVGIPMWGTSLTTFQGREATPFLRLTLRQRWRDKLVLRASGLRHLVANTAGLAVDRGRLLVWLLADGHSRNGERGALFLLSISKDGQVISARSIQAAPGNIAINNSRNFIVAPDGHLYEWYVDQHGAQLRRCPHRL